jgi:hypothetical protein
LCKEEPSYGVSETAIERTDETQPKYIRITDFSDDGIEPNHVFTTVAKYSAKHILSDGDILFARSGSVGRTFYFNKVFGLSVFAGYCIRFSINPKKALSKYVYWYTKTKRYAEWVNKIQRPAVQANINKEEYKSLEIILPSHEIQLQLTAKMDVAFESYSAKLREADSLLAGMDEYVLRALGIDANNFTPRLVVAVHVKTLKADKTFGAEYYHPERMAVIQALENNPNIQTKKLSDAVTFERNIVNAKDSDLQYLGLAGVESNTGELSGAVEEAAGQAFTYQSGDVL